MLVAPERGDFRPMARSIALNAGTPLPQVTDDFYGDPRPEGAPPTIGAVQEAAAASPFKQTIPGLTKKRS
jgi:hypothetical protein